MQSWIPELCHDSEWEDAKEDDAEGDKHATRMTKIQAKRDKRQKKKRERKKLCFLGAKKGGEVK